MLRLSPGFSSYFPQVPILPTNLPKNVKSGELICKSLTFSERGHPRVRAKSVNFPTHFYLLYYKPGTIANTPDAMGICKNNIAMVQ